MCSQFAPQLPINYTNFATALGKKRRFGAAASLPSPRETERRFSPPLGNRPAAPDEPPPPAGGAPGGHSGERNRRIHTCRARSRHWGRQRVLLRAGWHSAPRRRRGDRPRCRRRRDGRPWRGDRPRCSAGEKRGRGVAELLGGCPNRVPA